jgi:hypothetical protein
MPQWVAIALFLAGLGIDRYQKFKNQPLTQPNNSVNYNQQYPIQYCLMAYDPNTNKVWYQHENGTWYEQAPPIRIYNQNQPQASLGNEQRSQGRSSGYYVRQSPQAYANTEGY